MDQIEFGSAESRERLNARVTSKQLNIRAEAERIAEYTDPEEIAAIIEAEREELRTLAMTSIAVRNAGEALAAAEKASALLAIALTRARSARRAVFHDAELATASSGEIVVGGPRQQRLSRLIDSVSATLINVRAAASLLSEQQAVLDAASALADADE